LPGCGDARDYVNCNKISSDRYTNNPTPGVFGVFLDNKNGHIGVITAVTTNIAGAKICRFASAWGNPGSTKGGNVNIKEYPCSSFDTFIKP